MKYLIGDFSNTENSDAGARKFFLDPDNRPYAREPVLARMPDGKLAGDVDFAEVEKIASKITPVPGGVGPMTITMLLKNALTAAKMQKQA